jgi:hypothetical protein
MAAALETPTQILMVKMEPVLVLVVILHLTGGAVLAEGLILLAVLLMATFQAKAETERMSLPNHG